MPRFPKRRRGEIFDFYNTMLESGVNKKKRIQEYQELREQMKNSVEGQRSLKLSKMMQAVDGVVTTSRVDVARATERLADELYEAIKQGLGLYELPSNITYNKDVSMLELDRVINEYLPALKKLRRLCANEDISSKTKSRVYTVYEALFARLIELDARFALYAPKAVLYKPTVVTRVSGLPEDIKFEVEVCREEMKENPNADYVHQYLVCEFEPGNPRVRDAKGMVKRVNEVERGVADKMVDATEVLANDILNFTKEELETLKNENEKINFKQYSDLFNSSYFARQKLVELIRDKHISKRAKWEFSPHKALLKQIILLNGNFLVCILEEYLQRYNGVDNRVLTEQERKDIFEILDEEKVLSNPKHAPLKAKYGVMFMDLMSETSVD